MAAGRSTQLFGHDKLPHCRKLDAFGDHYIEGAGLSNPKDIEFFAKPNEKI